MEKREKMAAWDEDAIKQSLQKAAEAEQIPESLHPKQMEAWLKAKVAGKEHSGQDIGQTADTDKIPFGQDIGQTVDKIHSGQDANQAANGRQNGAGADIQQKKQKISYKWWYGTAVAACLAIVLFVAGRAMNWNIGLSEIGDGVVEEQQDMTDGAAASDDVAEDTEAADEVAEDAIDEAEQSINPLKKGADYKELYQAFCKVWENQSGLGYYNAVRGDNGGAAAAEESQYLGEPEDGESVAAGEPQYAEEPEDLIATGIEDEDVAELAIDESMDGESTAPATEDAGDASTDHGTTNQQEEEVEEADIIKNDGRYIYHVVSTDFALSREGIQITDTQDGLKKAATIDGFDEIQEMYVWEDTLVVIETGWASNPNGDTAKGSPLEDTVYETFTVPFSKIHIYDITDRSNPQKYHEFTIKGDYKDSRISDGYLYFFAGYTSYRPQKEENYKAYIPEIDNEPLASDRIYLPESIEDTSYMVMASIRMEQPDTLTDTKAIVASAENFYVSKGSIYVTNSQSIDYSQEGRQSDSTNIYRFTYQDGKMEKAAEGSVKGTLRDHFAMNEYDGSLRIVTTLNEEDLQVVTDDVTGEAIGYTSAETATSNSLYVLNQDLQVTGEITDIARGERIYSARFMGDTGYFVTFRQVDPLFSVDLSDPQNPKILGELKISGFSEYLHPYAENMLLGIGMEADESTGAAEGLKLTMFDIANPTDVKEQSTLQLPDYDYAYALYDYKAVLIDTKKNLFGFCADRYADEGAPYSYLLFSYENGEFQKRLEINCSEAIQDDSDTIRGTYIGDIFYLTYYSGRVEAYRLNDGSKIEELSPTDVEGGDVLPGEMP